MFLMDTLGLQKPRNQPKDTQLHYGRHKRL